MKTLTLKKLLEIDLSIQIALIVFSIMLISFAGAVVWAFFVFYFGMGTWQLISFVLNYSRRKQKKSLIKIYKNALIFFFFFGIATTLPFLLPKVGGLFFLIYLFIMLFAGIFMAILYIDITVKDISNLKRHLLWNQKEL